MVLDDTQQQATVFGGKLAGVEPLDLATADLVEALQDLTVQVHTLQRLRDDGFFKYVSKPRRNQLLSNLDAKVDEVKDLVKTVHGSFKKIKRERIPEEKLDILLSARLTPLSSQLDLLLRR